MSLKIGSRTPWGPTRDVRQVLPGVVWVETDGHGGYKLDRRANASIPAALRRPGGWYEEDIHACIVDMCLTVPGRNAEVSRAIVRDYMPDEYTAATGIVVLREQSRVLRERDDLEKHAFDKIAIAVWGDWHPTVGGGMVGVMATPGGERIIGNPGATWWLIPGDDYGDSENFCSLGFIVDPAHAVRWENHP